jgi:hypothetical protein
MLLCHHRLYLNVYSVLVEKIFAKPERKSNGTNTTLLKEKYWTHPCAN